MSAPGGRPVPSAARWFVALAIAVGTNAARAQAPSPEPEIRTYVVQPGDSVWSIAAEFYGTGDKYPIVYQYNDFATKPPFLLRPGQVLRLPILGQGPEAQLDWLLRDVKAKPPRALDWLEARERMNLWRLYRVATGDESAAHIVFEDRSNLKLRENAMLVIYGASASATRTTRRDKTEVLLEEGTIQGGLAALDEGGARPAPLIVKTPSGQIDLLAKLAQVQAEVSASIVSVYDGQATVKAQGGAVDVQGGQGTVVKKGERPERARALPLAPPWRDGARPALIALVGPPGTTGTWEAEWLPAERAETYRVELAADEGFTKVLFDAEVGAGVTRLRLAELGAGRYWVRTATRDADKLESRPGMARALEAVRVVPTRALIRGADGVLEVAGLVGLAVDTTPWAAIGEAARVSIDGGAERPASEIVRLAEPGLHRVEIRARGAEARVEVRVLAAQARFEVSGEPLARATGARADIHLVIEDERGREALLPELVLETSEGETLALERAAIGWRASLPGGRALPARLAVRARWAGGELGAREIRLAPRPEDLAIDRQVKLPWPYRPSRTAPGEVIAPRPERRVAIDLALADRETAPGAVAVTLAGELALGDLGLGIGLLAQDIALTDAPGGQARVQDLALGARYALTLGPTTLTPYLRVALPLGAGHEARRLGVEPGALAHLDLGVLGFDARLALLAASDFGAHEGVFASALVAVSWRPVHVLAIGLSGESIVDFDGGSARNVVGLGLQAFFGDLRLGASLGVGLGDATRDTHASLLGRLVIDLGLGH